MALPVCISTSLVPRHSGRVFSATTMRNDRSQFLTICRRALACLWAGVGLCVIFAVLRHQFESGSFTPAIGLTIGLLFAIGAGGLFFNKRWGRISMGCLMILVVLWSADMLLFIAFRGLGSGRQSLLGLVVGLILACICTWSVLAATRHRSE